MQQAAPHLGQLQEAWLVIQLLECQARRGLRGREALQMPHPLLLQELVGVNRLLAAPVQQC